MFCIQNKILNHLMQLKGNFFLIALFFKIYSQLLFLKQILT